jgi:hypothetical protein
MTKALSKADRDAFIHRADHLLGEDILTDEETSAASMSRLSKTLRQEGYARFPIARFLAETARRKGVELSAMLAAECTDEPPKTIFAFLVKLCDSADWEIREYAGESLANFLKHHFGTFEDALLGLRKSPSENIRRGVVLAMKYLGKHRGVVKPAKLLSVLGAYMDDPSPYVRKNLGPFAIGDAMLLYYPAETLTFLKRHAKSRSEISRWNVGSAFTTSVGSKLGEDAMPILKRLSRDSDIMVRDESARALLNIVTRGTSTQAEAKAHLRELLRDNLLSKRVENRLKEAIE